MKTRNLFYLGIIIALSFTSCSENDVPNPPLPPDATNVVIVDYNIFTPRTWYADSVYLVPNTVKIDASLVIEAGSIIKFYSGSGLEVWDNGTIKAIGNKDKQILFTSIKDDIGGDHNKDGNATSPLPADWDLVDLGSQNGSQFQYCIFVYGGNESYSGVLELGENFSKVEYCLFAFNKTSVSADVFYGALSAQDAAKETVIRNNQFYANTVPLSINGHINIDNSNDFISSVDSLIPNTYNGIFVHGQDIITSSTIWEETEVAFVIQYDNFEIWDNYTLTLGDDVVLKFFTGAMLNLQNETVLIFGENVCFTSFKDDVKKGDTNGDGDATNPPPANEWLGVYNGNDFFTWSNILFSKNAF